MTPTFVITAFRLSDGRSVYLASGRRWSEDLAVAEGAPEEALLGDALAWSKTQEHEVCDPYVMKAAHDGERVVAVSARERIRAAGPAWVQDRFGYRTV